jgi:hypothetical protein
MNRSSLILAGAVAAVVVTALLLFRNADQPVVETSQQAAAKPESAPEPLVPANVPTPYAESAKALVPSPKTAQPPSEDPGEETEIKFQADDNGRLVNSERARLNLEKLYALYTPAERQQKLEELQATLPPAAARDLADMLERYINYDAAQRQTFPPGNDLSSPEEGLNVIDGMHNLRVQYFGADAANSMYGKEEKVQRELLRLMSLEKDGSLTIEEKAERAQAMYQNQMPETAAELAAGRKQAERSEAQQKQSPPRAN